MNELYKSLGIKKGVTAVIGAGGKTSLIRALAEELAGLGTVIITTSTKIYPADDVPNLIGATADGVKAALKKRSCVCVGENAPDGKLVSPLLSTEVLCDLADYVLVEADGSKHMPVKAHKPNEPVIPSRANQTILVAGLSAIGKTVREAAHCPDLFSSICGCGENDEITPERIARVINFERLHDRVFLNQADDGFRQAEKIAVLLDCPVIAGSLIKGVFKCLSL